MRGRFCFWLACVLAGVSALPAAEYVPGRGHAPEPEREFRAAWVASVWNVDWPSRPGLSPAQQRAELLRILDVLAGLRMNAVILQVRPECDALYRSKLEPWSYWLTGTQGKRPSDGYDPLEFAVTEAHRRGMELHAWFNPFRARANSRVSPARDHITRRKPHLIMKAGSQLWLDPGLSETREWTLGVMTDVVRRYDIDGVHIDDYFYPYPKHVGGGVRFQFDDSRTYGAYRAAGGRAPAEEWRRAQIDAFVEAMDDSVKRVKPWVKTGVSPFGIWRPGVPDGIEAGIDAYGHLFADSRKWLREGYIDYLSPQLYWRIDQTPHSFTKLADWWGDQNGKGRHVWPGIASSRIKGDGSDRQRRAIESVNQIDVARKETASREGAGHIHWSVKALMEDRDNLRSLLARSSYRDRALVPASPWMGRFRRPEQPRVEAKARGNEVSLSWAGDDGPVRWWVIQVAEDGRWRTERVIRTGTNRLNLTGRPQAVTVRAVGMDGRLSEPATLVRK